ncbi:MAG: hypothetical protein GY795_26550 [Desulfobacterales bacterium]|nr:hypothetical protein [Desulfobacterales bacterium]
MEQLSSNRFSEEKIVRILIVIAFAYFLLRLFFLAANISHYVPPDEDYHWGRAQIFHKCFFLPEYSEENYHLGLIKNTSYLYHLIMGYFLRLNFFPVSDLVFVRFINCIISFITVIYGYKWICLVTRNCFCHLLFVFLITNTPMFSFMGAVVTYDNFSNLFAAMSLYYMHLFFQEPSPDRFLIFCISLFGGDLTKTAFLPLFLIYMGILIVHKRKYLKIIFTVFKKFLRSLRLKQIILLGIALLLLFLNTSLYLKNIILYGKIIPEAHQVLKPEQFTKNRVFAQEWITHLYRSGKLSFEEAIQQANMIQHPGDRANTIYLLKIARDHITNQRSLTDRIQYIWIWLNIMLQGTVGIQAHLFMGKNAYTFGFYQLIFIFSFLVFIRYYKPSDSDGRLADAFTLCLFYGIILMQLVNYSFYSQTYSIVNALQGRYFFPVLIPFYGIMAYYLTNPFKKPFQIVIITIITIAFIYGDFPWFLQNATPRWFFPVG